MSEKDKSQFFNEIYGTYYNTMAVVIEAARNGKLDSEKLYEIVRENSFTESVIPITDAIHEERWQLVNSGYKTNIRNKPEMPLTNLQKRFLKAMIQDKRMRLFFKAEEISELENYLENVKPLFNPEDIEYYDKNAKGDDYLNAAYCQMFRDSLKKAHKTPYQLEYSVRDDEFGLCMGEGDLYIRDKEDIVLEIIDERNALDRISFNFSYLKKKCEKTGENRYLMTLTVDTIDMEDMVSHVLQFGPYVKAIAPDCFVEKIKERLRTQKEINNL